MFNAARLKFGRVLLLARVDFGLVPHVQFLQLLQVELRLQVLAHPNVAHLHDWAELGSPQLVEVVVEVVGALDELGLVRFDGQLHLDYHLAAVQQVHEDVLVALVESVLDPDDLDAGVGLPVPPLDFFVEGDDLILFR